jgi:predicted acetyltransferase
MPELVAPTVDLHSAWLEAHSEWGPGQHEDGFGLRPSDDVDTLEGFAAWVARLESQPGCAYRWIVDNGRVLGGIALRTGDDDYVRWAGHIGYGLRPSARGRGIGTWALNRAVGEARDFGLERLLAVCAVDNAASAKTIERCGGVLECVRDSEVGPLRRYWIAVPG